MGARDPGQSPKQLRFSLTRLFGKLAGGQCGQWPVTKAQQRRLAACSEA